MLTFVSDFFVVAYLEVVILVFCLLVFGSDFPVALVGLSVVLVWLVTGLLVKPVLAEVLLSRLEVVALLRLLVLVAGSTVVDNFVVFVPEVGSNVSVVEKSAFVVSEDIGVFPAIYYELSSVIYQ